jgi:hypothetical protein
MIQTLRRGFERFRETYERVASGYAKTGRSNARVSRPKELRFAWAEAAGELDGLLGGAVDALGEGV